MPLNEGDIFKHAGSESIVVYVNDCRARCFPMTTRVRVYTPQTGKNAGKIQIYHENPESFNISPQSEVEVISRGGQKALNDFLSGVTAANREEAKKRAATENTDTDMKKRTGKPIKNPRGGLAADAKADKAKATPKERKQSKCGYIDELLESGKYTKAEILDLVCEKFQIPKSKREGTISTINVRPSHMRKAGREAKWKPEPEAKAA